MFIEDVGLPGDAGAVLQDEGCADAIVAVEADLREDGPADAAFHHREAGGDVVDVEARVGLLDVMFRAPEAGTLLEGGVGVALDARELTERCMGIFRRDDETDRLLREETAALIPAELAADDGDVQLVI